MSKLPKWLQQIIEQTGHAAFGFALAAFVLYISDGTAWLAIGHLAVLAGLREFWWQLPINRPWDTALDFTMFLVGGVLAVVLL